MAYKFNPFTAKLEEYGPVLTGTGTVSAAADGTAALPGIAFAADTNTGIYSPGADQVAISTNGTGRLFVDSLGRVGIGTSPASTLHINGQTTAYGNGSASLFWGNTSTLGALTYSGITAIIQQNTTADGLAFWRGTTEQVRIDSSGRLLVGTSSARGTGYGSTASFQIESTSFPGAAASLTNNQASAAGPSINFLKTRGTTLGANTLVANNDVLGRIVFSGADGAASIQGAIITADVDGTPDLNDLPTRLVFSTTADGAASPTERMRITQSGAVLCGTTTTPTGSSAGTIVAQNKIVVGANGAGRDQHISGATGVVTASTGTAIFNFSCTPSSTRGASIRLWICTSAQTSGNTPSNYAVAQYTFQLHQTATNAISLNGATTLSEYTFVRATHLAFTDVGNSTCNVTLTNPTAVNQVFGYRVEILDSNGAWQLASVSVT